MTEQPIDRLRRVCKIEGVSIHDDAAVIKLCREYLDGDALLAAYRDFKNDRFMTSLSRSLRAYGFSVTTYR